MTREALAYIQRNHLHESILKHPQRAEAERSWNYPYAALEEALVNAVYHCSYEEREPIEVRISPEELVVVSYPGPDRSISLADLQAGRAVSRRYRNRRIGEFLKELDLTEGRATGIPKILQAMAANGSPTPRFETDEDRSAFVIRLPARLHGVDVARARSSLTDQVTDQVFQLLTVAEAGEVSRRELQDALGLKHAPHPARHTCCPR